LRALARKKTCFHDDLQTQKLPEKKLIPREFMMIRELIFTPERWLTSTSMLSYRLRRDLL